HTIFLLVIGVVRNSARETIDISYFLLGNIQFFYLS
ncbi:hypothetical protein LINPERPRIM_LOCUS3681, partial [Linum perenne]